VTAVTERVTPRVLAVAAVAALALLLTQALLVVPAAGAQADPCDAYEGPETAVVVTPPADAPVGPDGTVAVYRGSELVVHLCGPGADARTLDASGHDWATALEEGTDQLRIRVEGPTNDSIGDLASPSVPGPSLTIVDRTVETVLTNRSIPVASEERRTRLRNAEAAFLEQEAALESQLDDLATSTDAVANGSTSSGDPIAETMAARRSYRNATDDLRAALFAVADGRVGGPASAAAIRGLDDRSDAMENRTRERLNEHDDALGDRQRSLTWSLRLRAIGIGLVGLVLGALVGAILPIRRGRVARRRIAAGEWTTYSRRALLLPAAIGLTLCCLGVGWLVMRVGPALVEVMAP
jgi:hypothetical protein